MTRKIAGFILDQKGRGKLNKIAVSWILSIFIFATILTGLIFIPNAQAFTGEGLGTAAEPYQITTANQLNEIRDDLGKYYILMNDIDLGVIPYDVGWIPIDNFSGTLDGQGYTISNLYITNNEGESSRGFFGVLNTGGPTIKNCNLLGVDITAKDNAGGLIGMLGYNASGLTVENCTVTGNIVTEEAAGGLIGRIYRNANGTSGGTIINCHANVDVRSEKSRAGGLIAGIVISHANKHKAITMTINDCSASGSVVSQGYVSGSLGVGSYGTAGGLIGDLDANGKCTRVSINRCYATGDVSGLEDTSGVAWVGGFIGHSNGAMYSPYETSIRECYATGNVRGKTASGFGRNRSRSYMYNCFSLGNVEGNDSAYGFGGGFSNCYSAGYVDANLDVLGFGSGSNNCYWDTRTSGTSQGGTGQLYGRTTDYMYYSETFAEWDFSTIWDIDEGETYPYLRNLPKPDFTASEVVPVTGVSLNKNNVALAIGSTETLIATVSPDNATLKSIIWSSDNEAVATVDENGTVTSVAEGVAIITATTRHGSKTDTCEVTVTNLNPIITINEPISGSAYSEVSGHNIINVSGAVTGTDNSTITATLTQIVVDGVPFSLSKNIVLSEGEFSLLFNILEDNLPEGIYEITVVAE